MDSRSDKCMIGSMLAKGQGLAKDGTKVRNMVDEGHSGIMELSVKK